MAVVYITEYTRTPLDIGQSIPAGQEPGVNQTVAITAGSVQSAAFGADTKFVRIHTDAICSIKFGTAPTAAATDARLPANGTEFFGVRPGDKVAVITNT